LATAGGGAGFAYRGGDGPRVAGAGAGAGTGGSTATGSGGATNVSPGSNTTPDCVVTAGGGFETELGIAMGA
jgi:hypothetical protein